MDSEVSYNVEKQELKKEGLINIDALSFEFCNDGLIHDFYEEKLRELENKEKWLKNNRKKLEQNKKKIKKAVKNGLIANTNHETIWQFQINKAKEGQEKVPTVKNELMGRIDEIKMAVIKRLGKYLPDWTAKTAKIVFTMNEDADFCIDGDIITIDLSRLLFEQNPTEKVKQGISHEVFHFWMSEGQEWPNSEQSEISDQNLKDRIIFGTINEGLAVLISGQSLSNHHTKQGRDFLEYTNESFSSFNHFLSEENHESLEKIQDEEFQDMGHFYVVGNEIVSTVLQYDGIEKFRAQIVDARDNPSIFLQRYREICDRNKELCKINS